MDRIPPSPIAGSSPDAPRSPKRRATQSLSEFVQRLVDDVLEVAELPTSLQPESFATEALAPIREPEPRPHLRQGRRPTGPASCRNDSDRSWAPATSGARNHEVRNGCGLWVAAGQRPDSRRAQGRHCGRSGQHAVAIVAATGDLVQLAHLALAGGSTSGSWRRWQKRSHDSFRREWDACSRSWHDRHDRGSRGDLEVPEVRRFILSRLAEIDLDGRSLSRHSGRHQDLPPPIDSCLPWPRPSKTRVRSCTAVVALGTHAPMTEEAMSAMVGSAGFDVVNHEWWADTTFAGVGKLSAGTVSELSNGNLSEPVYVRINRLVLESDVTIIVGPVLPHEVVGFSGGNKYLFPGLSGQELIDVTHWLGAFITSGSMIGTRGVTPVRALIDAAAELVPGERHAFCAVVDHATGGLHSLSFGAPEEAWASAAGIAAETHIEYLPPRSDGCCRSCLTVRGPLDRCQGLLQGRTRRRRWWRGCALCAPHH